MEDEYEIIIFEIFSIIRDESTETHAFICLAAKQNVQTMQFWSSGKRQTMETMSNGI